jgi:hypothetical protein
MVKKKKNYKKRLKNPKELLKKNKIEKKIYNKNH